MRGREAGTLDEMRATGRVAGRAREAGLARAGGGDTFIQWWPLRRTRLSTAIQIHVAGRGLAVWRDAVVLTPAPSPIDAAIVFLRDTSELAASNVRGKAVAIEVQPVATQPLAQFTIRGNFQATTAQHMRTMAAALARGGAAAAILV